MGSFVFKDAQAVRTQILALIVAYPELEEDATLLADSLEGETDLHRVLEKLLGERREAETMASAIKEREGDMQERRKRFERKSAGVKKIILQLMEAAHQEKITLPEATLSITKPRVSVDVTDLDALPQGFFKTERKALTAEIKTALESGNAIPGAQLVMGDVGLTVRVK
jgi:DNA repair exonuclease SbcCD ATPase subunit